MSCSYSYRMAGMRLLYTLQLHHVPYKILHGLQAEPMAQHSIYFLFTRLIELKLNNVIMVLVSLICLFVHIFLSLCRQCGSVSARCECEQPTTPITIEKCYILCLNSPLSWIRHLTEHVLCGAMQFNFRSMRHVWDMTCITHGAFILLDNHNLDIVPIQ